MIQTPLTVFVCPSGPGGAAERIYDGEAPLGSLTLTWRAAPSDYTPITGVRGTYANLAYANWTGTGSRHGAIQPRAGSMGDKSSRIVDISDGLSNTIMFAERIGGGKIIRKNRQIGNPTTDDLLGRSNGGGWGDFLNGEHWPQGSLADGASASNGGPCAINCNNVRSEGFYAAHPGGMQAAMCDGSVTFVSETVGAFVFAAAITRGGGEIASLP